MTSDYHANQFIIWHGKNIVDGHQSLEIAAVDSSMDKMYDLTILHHSLCP